MAGPHFSLIYYFWRYSAHNSAAHVSVANVTVFFSPSVVKLPTPLPNTNTPQQKVDCPLRLYTVYSASEARRFWSCLSCLRRRDRRKSGVLAGVVAIFPAPLQRLS